MPSETLADVKAGDEVVLFIGWDYEKYIVEGVTKTRIILADDRRYKKQSKNTWNIGRRVGGSGYINVGPTAAARIKEIDIDRCRMCAQNEWFQAARFGFSREGVRT